MHLDLNSSIDSPPKQLVQVVVLYISVQAFSLSLQTHQCSVSRTFYMVVKLSY
uniref:Uncharacterized protein n=1 Tax=Setaria viridis TaxID=4556 RepID=A0A4U6T5H5_SETVI|nr:hypothetical protein SEVIR_9G380450v2 [Setaria viridis]